ncbi:MAG: pgaB 2 [Anaerospora sp.]|jgi:peptidoglycan/xylan/chitin deacetylase (PgdA/CDA1 family)|nr:pgaB 2 [Anaerospora sp.]
MNKNFRLVQTLFIIVVFFLTGCGNISKQPESSEGPKGQTSITVRDKAPAASLSVPRGIPVLMYHSIGDERDNDAVISKERFVEQMDFLYKNHYNPITLDELAGYISEGKALPEKPVVLTFDDGYRDTFDVAMPVLKQYRFPSMVFIPAGEVGTNLTWEQLKEMKASGMQVGSHSYFHRELAKLSPAEQAEEIAKSKQVLDRNLNQDTRWFCYPYSSYNDITLKLLREKGMTFAVTTNAGWAKKGDNPLVLNRVWIGNSVDLKHFEERLTKEDYSIL